MLEIKIYKYFIRFYAYNLYYSMLHNICDYIHNYIKYSL